jgi:hypothetical protein
MRRRGDRSSPTRHSRELSPSAWPERPAAATDGSRTVIRSLSAPPLTICGGGHPQLDSSRNMRLSSARSTLGERNTSPLLSTGFRDISGPRAFSRTSLIAQRDAGIGETDAPGSRIPRRPGGLDRGGRLRRGVPGHVRLPGSGPLDDPGLVPILRPGIQIEDGGGIRIVLAGSPPLAHRVVTGDQLRHLDDAPRVACAADGGASAMAIRKTLSADRRVRSGMCPLVLCSAIS